MTTFTIHPWRDYHGDPICFGVFTDDGYEADRCVSEQEAEFACAYFEASAEDARRGSIDLVYEVALAEDAQREAVE